MSRKKSADGKNPMKIISTRPAASHVSVSTREYEFNHGAKPRGFGSWAFLFEGDLTVHWMRDAQGGSMTFSDAKRAARKLAASHGCLWISVCS
jgi:hypothetical protein